MFRIFLRKKIKSGETKDGPRTISRPSFKRNKRIHERFNVHHDSLQVMNDQDILVIRDISSKGFASDVSESSFQKFVIGDVYDGRIKYFKELYDFKIKLSWKKNRAVGFEIIDSDEGGRKFIQRLLKPIELAKSLQEMKAEYLTEEASGRKSWFHSDQENTDLYIWYHEDGRLEAWRFASGDLYVQWDESDELTTGKVVQGEGFHTADGLSTSEPHYLKDKQNNAQALQYAFDVISALDSAKKHEIIAIIEKR